MEPDRRIAGNMKARSQEDFLPIWGFHPVKEFLAARPEAFTGLFVLPSFGRKKTHEALLALSRRQGIVAERVQDFRGRGIPDSATHQGVAAWVKRFWSVDIVAIEACWHDESPLLVIGDQVTDPGNLGALLRSAGAFGAQAVILPGRGSAPVNGVVVKASSGALAHTSVCTVGNLARTLIRLKGLGLWTVGLAPDAEAPLWGIDLVRPVALVAGSEDRGLRPLVRRQCDVLGRIPHGAGLGSLNVASAVSIALYEAVRQRSVSGSKAGLKV